MSTLYTSILLLIMLTYLLLIYHHYLFSPQSPITSHQSPITIIPL
ncbi:MAG: hypothetical protein ACKO2Z_07940 [Sphaerospermopsis kisseleviana]